MGLVFRLPLRALRQPENGLCFVVSIRLALTMRLVPTGHLLFFASPKKSKKKKGDPDVQVRCANFPHCASFFRRVRTSRATRVVGQVHAFSRKKDAPFGWT